MKNYIILAILALFFGGCKSEEEKQQIAMMNEYTALGDKIAKISFESLSGNLKAAMKEGGPANAIKFCNMNALPLTDSLAKTFKVNIKRTSLKLRNPKNQPDTLESYMLDLYAQIQKMQKPLVSKHFWRRQMMCAILPLFCSKSNA